ncbi:MAG: hypothetical protein NZ742_08220 [Acidobacteria bacterium]|nr:hypothetical protein [Acidobacteriota bacterium]MDW7983938.1 hypothetical protein [Acidobacteriota bacterium]
MSFFSRIVLCSWWPSIRQSLAALFLSCAGGTWWAWADGRSEALPVGTAVFGTVGLFLSLGADPAGRRARWRDVTLTVGLVAGAVGTAVFTPTGGLVGALWAVLAGLWAVRLYVGLRPPFQRMADIGPGIYAVPWLVALGLGLHWSMAWRHTVAPALVAAGVLWSVTWFVYRHTRAWYRLDLKALPDIVRGGAYLLRPLWRSHGIVYGLLASLSTWNVFLRREWLDVILWTLLMGTYMATLWIAHQWAALWMYDAGSRAPGPRSQEDPAH